MKKLIASLLTVATVASMASFSAFAAEDVTKTATVAGGAVYNDDKEVMTKNEIQPDTTFYIDLDEIEDIPAGALLLDEDMFKSKTDKGDDDTKIIKKISVVEKDVIASAEGETDKDGRENVIKIELNEDMTDTEFKITPSVTFTAKYDMDTAGEEATGDDIEYANGDKFTVELEKFYVSNSVEKSDRDWTAGTSGWVAKPIKNDDNEVTWEDENDTIARLTFEGDSDVNKYYPKLSTKWDNADYAENFAGTDAFFFSFVGTPTISSTSRPVLELYNPFVDEDGEETVAVEDIVIYEVVDGALVDVTEKFTAGENDDGDSVFTIKTRTLGTYIFSNGAATPAADEEPAVEEPVDGKENPGTGRF